MGEEKLIGLVRQFCRFSEDSHKAGDWFVRCTLVKDDDDWSHSDCCADNCKLLKLMKLISKNER